MKTEHTPGRWQLSARGLDHWTIEKSDDERRSVIADVYDNKLCREHGGTAAANASLISAAPDLLAALTMMVQEKADYMRINCLGDPEKQHAMKAARVAIAKATNACHD